MKIFATKLFSTPVAKRGFLRNSRKYGQGFLRKTPTEGTAPKGPGPTIGQLALNLQPTNQPDFLV